MTAPLMPGTQGAQKFACASTLALALLLGGCQAANTPKALDSVMGERSKVEARLATAASEAVAQGKTDEALAHYEELYKRDKRDPAIALNYAQLLRKTGKAQQSLDILEPMVLANGKKKSGADPLVQTEYAATLIALGRLDEAKTVLDDVLANPDAARERRDASNLEGVILDAQGQHAEAEKLFRVALDGWQGDATPVMNNLALCLSAQGKFDESLDILRRALIMSPNRQEIARNVEMVTDLRNAIVPSAPVSLKKK